MKPNSNSKNKKPWLILTILMVTLGVFSLATWKFIIPTFFSSSLPNYAQEVAKPLEAALTNGGAIKHCSTGDNGRSSDNDEPNYTAIYELKKGSEDAMQFISKIASENSYNLTDQTHRINAGVNKLYMDESKKSPYPDLEDGNVMLGFDIYKDKVYSEGQFCGIKEHNDSSSDRTTVRLSVSLPAFKQ